MPLRASGCSVSALTRRQAKGTPAPSISWLTRRGRQYAGAWRTTHYFPVEDFPLSPRAAELGQTLFGEGLGFLKASYPEQSATTSALLRRIDEDRLSKDLDAICGPEFLRNVRKQQPRYEAMVAATLKREAGGPDLNPQLRGLARAIVGYAIKVAASVEDDDQKTVDRARAALRPLDTFRANNPPTERAAKSPTPAAEPAAPTAGKSGSEDPEAA